MRSRFGLPFQPDARARDASQSRMTSGDVETYTTDARPAADGSGAGRGAARAQLCSPSRHSRPSRTTSGERSWGRPACCTGRVRASQNRRTRPSASSRSPSATWGRRRDRSADQPRSAPSAARAAHLRRGRYWARPIPTCRLKQGSTASRRPPTRSEDLEKARGRGAHQGGDPDRAQKTARAGARRHAHPTASAVALDIGQCPRPVWTAPVSTLVRRRRTRAPKAVAKEALLAPLPIAASGASRRLGLELGSRVA